MSVPPSPSHACYCINPCCSHPYPQRWADASCPICGTSLRLQNRYIPVQRIHTSPTIPVYSVYDQKTGSDRLLRVLVTPDHHARTTFYQEAVGLSSLHDRGLPKVEREGYFQIEIKQPQARVLPCLVMDAVVGPTFQDLLCRHPNGCPEAWVTNWLRQAVGLLQKLHSHQIIHRDIKPASFAVLQNGQLLAIADLPFPRPLAEGESTQPLASGYRPPGLNDDEPPPSADFYGLGRVCIHLLTGRHPLLLEVDGVLQWRHHTRVRGALADLLDSMVQLDERLRPAPEAIADQLARLSTKPTPTSANPPAPRPPVVPRPTPINPPPSSLSPGSSGSGMPSTGDSRPRVGAAAPAARARSSPHSSGNVPPRPLSARPAVPRSKTPPRSHRSSPVTGRSFGGSAMLRGASGGSARTQSPPASSNEGRYREDPHPRNLMPLRSRQPTLRSRLEDAIETTDQARNWAVQVCIAMFRASVLAGMLGGLATAIGFWLTYWSFLTPLINQLFAHQLASPGMPLVVTPAMIVCAFAGVGIASGLTWSHLQEMAGQVWQKRAWAGVVFAIAWVTWQLAATGITPSQAIARLTAVMALGLTLAFGTRSNIILQTALTTLGTSITFLFLMQQQVWQPGLVQCLFPPLSIPTPAWLTACGTANEPMLLAAIAFFGLVGIVFGCWFGLGYYIVVPLFDWIRRVVRSR